VNGVQILIVIGAGIGIAGVTRRWGIVQPGIVIVVPPLLYSATRGASFSSFGQNLRAILSLGVVLVVLTVGVFGYVSSWLLPTLPMARRPATRLARTCPLSANSDALVRRGPILSADVHDARPDHDGADACRAGFAAIDPPALPASRPGARRRLSTLLSFSS
jgi:hypothetical protein